eukprot:m.7719 g.7719  ORF g.7719 m.7719 type:complete len:162 (-) comp3031_c0_seq1:46-531(-)
MSSFRFFVWDPWLLVLQMVCLQCLHYVTLAILVALLSRAIGADVSLNLVFSHNALDIWQLVPAFMFNALVSAVLLWVVVGRAKQCLDFACTVFFFHLVATWAYTGEFPSRLSWWLMHAACVTVTALAGEYICMHADLSSIELKEPKATPRKAPTRPSMPTL